MAEERQQWAISKWILWVTDDTRALKRKEGRYNENPLWNPPPPPYLLNCDLIVGGHIFVVKFWKLEMRDKLYFPWKLFSTEDLHQTGGIKT